MKIEGIKARLDDAVADYNEKLAQEQEAERLRAQARDERISAFGKLQALDELHTSALQQASIEASEDGDGGENADVVAPVPEGDSV